MHKESKGIKITESPRDAMQGLKYFIPTEDKARYINALLKVGFDIIDFGSFVSPKAIPQFSDISELLALLETDGSDTELLAIIGNTRWGETAAAYDIIDWFGFPFSISTTFQKMNLNRTPEESLDTVKSLLEICEKNEKKFRAYLSMAFGNPYHDKWNIDIVAEWILRLNQQGVKHIAISDTVGFSDPEIIAKLFNLIFKEFPSVEFGFHLHTSRKKLHDKIEAAWESGCRNFDSVLTGVGGCPLSGYELVGNLDTADLISFFDHKGVRHGLNNLEMDKAVQIANSVFRPPMPKGNINS
ncbi:MAG: hydroxymethylglutaryl-CoA lyase [Bacteroidales bacterium]|nr:hydroxymethylglutaryl-CoA lyase [Bacteroidales bacterium]